MAHLKGQNVNLLIKSGTTYSVIAASTSCDFSVTANTTDGSAKDDANPLWDNPAFTYSDWSASNESFIIGTTDLKTLLTTMVTGDCTVELQWQCAGMDGLCKHGTAIITSLEVDAPADDYTKLSLSFEGASALENGTVVEITPVTAVRNKMRGKALMVAYNDGQDWHTICAATGHKLSINVQTADVKTKDDNDKAISKEVTGKSMTLSTDNLCNLGDLETCQAEKVDALLGFALDGTVEQFELGYYPAAVGSAVDDTGDWGEGEAIITGEFICTSFSANGANKDNATFSAEFTLCGVPTIA